MNDENNNEMVPRELYEEAKCLFEKAMVEISVLNQNLEDSVNRLNQMVDICDELEELNADLAGEKKALKLERDNLKARNDKYKAGVISLGLIILVLVLA